MTPSTICLHSLLSSASAVSTRSPVVDVVWSSHLIGGRLLLLFPPISPNITTLSRLSSSLFTRCPKYVNIRHSTISANRVSIPSFSNMLVFFSIHEIPHILLQHHI